MKRAARTATHVSKKHQCDNADSVAALRKLGAIVVLDGGGDVKNVDLSNTTDNVKLASLHLKRLAHLRTLCLSGTPITNENLAEHVDYSDLIVLDLSRTSVTDAGMVCLEQAIQLEWLNLDGTRVTDAGIHHLFPLVNLRWVSLRDTPVTDEGMQQLFDMHPDLTIPRVVR